MKSYNYIWLLILGLLFACDENDEVPPYRVVGEAYATFVDFSISNDSPPAGDDINIVVQYSNYVEDPIVSVTLLEQVDGGSRNEITVLDESSAPTGELITRTVGYTVPNVDSGTTISIFVELRSRKEFPQIEGVELTVL